MVIYSGVIKQNRNGTIAANITEKYRNEGNNKLAWFLVTEGESSKETQNYDVFETRQTMLKEKKKTEATELLYGMSIRSNKLYSHILKAT